MKHAILCLTILCSIESTNECVNRYSNRTFVSTADAEYLINIVLGKADKDDFETETVDFNHNGVLDITDITKLLEQLMKQKQ